MKRPFQRQQGQLIDDFEGPDGRSVRYAAPAAMFGEELSPEIRGELLADLGTGSQTEHGAIYALSNECSPEYVNGLLDSFRLGSISSPMPLTRFVDDPRVQPALLASTAKASAGELANFAQVLGHVGGVGARQLLRERMQSLLNRPATYRPDDFHNWHAGSLASVGKALLHLEPDALDAADALIGLTTHRCKSNRQSAIRMVTEVLATEPCVQVRDRLRQKIHTLLSAEDDDAFLAAAPALIETHTDEALARLKKHLTSESEDVRMRVVNVLTASPSFAGRCLSLLAMHLDHETSVDLRARIVGHLRELTPPGRTKMVAAQTLAAASPALRMEAFWLLPLLDQADAAELAKAALTDEPDPLLVRRLREFVRD